MSDGLASELVEVGVGIYAIDKFLGMDKNMNRRKAKKKAHRTTKRKSKK